MPYRELTLQEIENWLGIKKKVIPKHLILYASWPWPLKERLKEVRRYLKNPKEVGRRALGNYWIGKLNNKKVGFMLVYGHGMAADMLYLMTRLGVKYIYQIGSMGALQKQMNLFDLVIPQRAIKFEGLSHLFFKEKFVECDRELLNLTKKILEEKKFKNYHVGKTISIDFLFAETKDRVKKWSKNGFLAIDMETATTYAMAKLSKVKTIAILRIIDSVVKEGELISDLEYKKRKDEAQKLKKFVKEVISELIDRIDKSKD
jgi:purine-nucleoside phosphorylase